MIIFGQRYIGGHEIISKTKKRKENVNSTIWSHILNISNIKRRKFFHSYLFVCLFVVFLKKKNNHRSFWLESALVLISWVTITDLIMSLWRWRLRTLIFTHETCAVDIMHSPIHRTHSQTNNKYEINSIHCPLSGTKFLLTSYHKLLLTIYQKNELDSALFLHKNDNKTIVTLVLWQWSIKMISLSFKNQTHYQIEHGNAMARMQNWLI